MPSLHSRIVAFADSITDNFHAMLPDNWSLQNISAPIPNGTAFQPTFINFFVSPYFLVLLFLSIVINRIHAIVSPRNAHPLPFLTKLGVRTPSIFLLCKSITILLSFLSSIHEWRDHLPSFVAEASAGMKGGDVLWAAFKAMSTVTIIETFLSCVERRPSPQEQTVSLFEWAIMLYFTTAGNEIFLVAFIQVCQLLVLQLTFLHPRGYAYRLIPTTVFGLAGLLHFCYSLWSFSSTYPSLQFLARLPELMVVCITIVSISIHLLAMKVGNFRRHMFEPHSLPGLHEDYAIAIFKLGSACLEATRGVGYRNEVESIRVPAGTVVDDHQHNLRPSIVKLEKHHQAPRPPLSAFENEMADDVGQVYESEPPMYQQVRFHHIGTFCTTCVELVRSFWRAVRAGARRTYRRVVYRTIEMPLLLHKEEGRDEEEEEEGAEHDDEEELFRRFVADDWKLFEEEAEDEDEDYCVTDEESGIVDENDEDADDFANCVDQQDFASDGARSLTPGSVAPLVEELLDLAMDMREQDMQPSTTSTPSSSFFALPSTSPFSSPTNQATSTPLLSLFIAHYLHPSTVTRTRYRNITNPPAEEDQHDRRGSYPSGSHIRLLPPPPLPPLQMLTSYRRLHHPCASCVSRRLAPFCSGRVAASCYVMSAEKVWLSGGLKIARAVGGRSTGIAEYICHEEVTDIGEAEKPCAKIMSGYVIFAAFNV
ncbi:hypothetical protein BC936DRAFT_140428 [Jimgerdemannia flammicorona]|uniref:Uncharacterized protein n=1 Tax=Jimgerdemannia flammicorona TaxID=994334 RepID=A0A433DH11_9FUNG|nr:hypothetical protein BC936DRAFT_140428 [Jimgerdemannia flammicorona]